VEEDPLLSQWRHNFWFIMIWIPSLATFGCVSLPTGRGFDYDSSTKPRCCNHQVDEYVLICTYGPGEALLDDSRGLTTNEFLYTTFSAKYHEYVRELGPAFVYNARMEDKRHVAVLVNLRESPIGLPRGIFLLRGDRIVARLLCNEENSLRIMVGLVEALD